MRSRSGLMTTWNEEITKPLLVFCSKAVWHLIPLFLFLHQAGESMFNRAKLLNVGFKEALKDYDYNCFVFSDVDLIPMNDHNAYRCFSQPRHISVAMDKFGFR